MKNCRNSFFFRIADQQYKLGSHVCVVGDWHSVRICRHSNRQTLSERGNLGRCRIFRSQDGATADHEKDCQHENNIERVFGERCSYSLLRKQVLYNKSYHSRIFVASLW